jgi:hypothetical protein
VLDNAHESKHDLREAIDGSTKLTMSATNLTSSLLKNLICFVALDRLAPTYS